MRDRFRLSDVRVRPLSERRTLTRAEVVLAAGEGDLPRLAQDDGVSARLAAQVEASALAVRAARERGASVMWIYGAHFLRNGGASVMGRLLRGGWVTHLATNGAGSIHDWEYAWLGGSTEGVEENVMAGTFGTWDETSRHLHGAVMLGALEGMGYGDSVARLIAEDGWEVPQVEALEAAVRQDPADPLNGARCEVIQAMRRGFLESGRWVVSHRWKEASIFAQAWRAGVSVTVHPGIGYDIITNHPMFSGAALGRGGGKDFEVFCGAVSGLEGGVVFSVGSAVMGPQVFEKSVSCVNNVRLQRGASVLSGHRVVVVDVQDGGGWDWTVGEPPKSNPAYYLRFCKSYSRMGGVTDYLQVDNVVFARHLLAALEGGA